MPEKKFPSFEGDFNDIHHQLHTHDSLQDLINRGGDIDEERYEREYLGIPVTVSDGLRIEGMRKKIAWLEKANDKHIFEKEILEVENLDKTNRYEEILEENKMLKAEVEKIRSRFDILDL